MLAMDINDNAGCLNARGVHTSIVGTPPGACSLLQGVTHPPKPGRLSGRLGRF